MSEYSGCDDFSALEEAYGIKKNKKEFKYTCDAGNYTSESLIGLTWAIFTHRMWHLFTHGKWMDQEIKMRTAKYFTATWCGPCKAFKPIILELISEGYNITIHDVDENQELASKYGVRSIPTTVIEENGVEVDRFVGALPKQSVIQKLNG